MSAPPQIDVWICRLDAADDRLSKWRKLLSPDELERSARFVFPHDRAKFVAARGQLREILSRYVCIPPHRIEFEYGPHGKPYIRSAVGSLQFNMSHSAYLAAIAISTTEEVGVDIEQIRPAKEDIAERYFSAAECAALNQLSHADRLRGFYNVWTRKEAVIKALGCGLSMPLRSFDVSVGEHEAVRFERLGDDVHAGENWVLTAFEPHPGFVGALAVPTRSQSIDLKLLTCE